MKAIDARFEKNGSCTFLNAAEVSDKNERNLETRMNTSQTQRLIRGPPSQRNIFDAAAANIGGGAKLPPRTSQSGSRANN